MAHTLFNTKQLAQRAQLVFPVPQRPRYLFHVEVDTIQQQEPQVALNALPETTARAKLQVQFLVPLVIFQQQELPHAQLAQPATVALEMLQLCNAMLASILYLKQ